MFGYVTVCEPELKVKDYRKYKAYYCGLCRTLREKYGSMGQMTLTYDMTFAVILLTSLYESETEIKEHRCKIHPVKRQKMLQNEMTEYSAAMNLILAYYHLKDNWIDEQKILGFLGSNALKSKIKSVIRQYPRQSRVIRRELTKLAKCEKEGSTDIDRVSGCFGRLMSELFVYKKDHWEPYLRKMGFFLGKYVYIMDAYDDLAEDQKKGNYNPLQSLSDEEGYEERIRQMLCMMIGECSASFEHLPCVLDVDILRNILYDGVWTRYRKLQVEAKQRKES